MGIMKERQYLIDDGFKLAPYISFNVFTELWKKHVNKETSIGIIRGFWEDYCTSTVENYTEYFITIED